MLFGPMTEPVRPTLQEPGLESLMALEGLNGYDQLEISSRQVVGILRAYRSAFVSSRERRGDFDALCDGLLDWLEAEIDTLRFAKPH